jgi:hypothetical protein
MSAFGGHNSLTQAYKQKQGPGRSTEEEFFTPDHTTLYSEISSVRVGL